MRHATRLAVVFVGLTAGCGPAVRPYRVHRGLAYGPHEDQVFDHYQPVHPRAGLRPTVIVVHGGAWRARVQLGRDVAMDLCPRGYDVIAVRYRLAPQYHWPAQYEDVRDALAWVRANGARLGCDPDRVALYGCSAGGHLAAMVAFRAQPSPPVVVVAGESDLTVAGSEIIMNDEDAILTDLFGVPGPWPKPLLTDASPVTWAHPYVSVQIVHARGDMNVRYEQGERLRAKLASLGADVSMVTLENGEHSHAWDEPQSARAIHAFLRRLNPRRPSPSTTRFISDAQDVAVDYLPGR